MPCGLVRVRGMKRKWKRGKKSRPVKYVYVDKTPHRVVKGRKYYFLVPVKKSGG